MSTLTDRQQEKIDKKAGALFEAITKMSVAKVELEAARKDRSGPPEVVSDKAQDFRKLESEVAAKLDALVTYQCSILTGDDKPED